MNVYNYIIVTIDYHHILYYKLLIKKITILLNISFNHIIEITYI